MAAKRHRAKEIVTKLRQVDVLNAQGKSMAEAIGEIFKPARRRTCVDHVTAELEVSERRACRVLGQHRST